MRRPVRRIFFGRRKASGCTSLDRFNFWLDNRRLMRRRILLVLLICSAPVTAAEIKVSSAADISAGLPGLEPGDTLVMLVGKFRYQAIGFKGDGGAGNA